MAKPKKTNAMAGGRVVATLLPIHVKMGKNLSALLKKGSPAGVDGACQLLLCAKETAIAVFDGYIRMLKSRTNGRIRIEKRPS